MMQMFRAWLETEAAEPHTRAEEEAGNRRANHPTHGGGILLKLTPRATRKGRRDQERDPSSLPGVPFHLG